MLLDTIPKTFGIAQSDEILELQKGIFCFVVPYNKIQSTL